MKNITLENGLVIGVDLENDKNELIIKTYIKMKTTGDYKLYHTMHLGNIKKDEGLTLTEQMLLNS